MIEHKITLTREQLQEAWDTSSRLCERLTEAVRTLAIERDLAESHQGELRCAVAAMLGAYADQAVTPEQRAAEKIARKSVAYYDAGKP